MPGLDHSSLRIYNWAMRSSKFPTLFLIIVFSVAPFFQTQAASPEAGSSNLNLWDMVLAAEWVLIPLVLISLIVITLIVFNFFWLRQSNIFDNEFYETAGHLLKERKLEDLLELCSENKTATTRVLRRVLEFARDNPGTSLEALKEIAEVEGNNATMKLNQPNLLLMDMGVLAPLVGLLGTVFGILRSFGTIASDAAPMRTMLLAGGVSQALVSTAIGICIGLTAMLFYAFFRTRVQSLVGRFESILTELMVKTYACLAKGR